MLIHEKESKEDLMMKYPIHISCTAQVLRHGFCTHGALGMVTKSPPPPPQKKKKKKPNKQTNKTKQNKTKQKQKNQQTNAEPDSIVIATDEVSLTD